MFQSNLPEALAATSGLAAAGTVLTMLADTMMPKAFAHGGRAAELATTMGFISAVALVAWERAS